MIDLAGKVAFVTGGTSGIGRGIAHALLEAGMSVAITWRRPDHLRETLEALGPFADRVLPIELDVSDREAMRRAADEVEARLGRVRVLCNNAGIGILTPLLQATYNDWDWGISVNLGGVVNGIQTFLPRMLDGGEPAHIVSTASMGGLFVVGRAGIYTTTKYAVVGLMEALKGEVEPFDIGVSVYCPGLVNSNIMETELSRPERYAEPKRRRDGVTRAMRGQMAKGMDPLEAGRHVLEGIRRNDLYILTHPEFAPGFEERSEAILAALRRQPPPPAQRAEAQLNVLRYEPYAQERDRLLQEKQTRAADIGGGGNGRDL